MKQHLLFFLAKHPKLRTFIAHALLPLKTRSINKQYQYARKHIPFYQKRFKGLGERPKFSDIPVLDKHGLPLDPYSFMDTQKRILYYNSTSGSSGVSTPTAIGNEEIGSYWKMALFSPYYTQITDALKAKAVAVNIFTYGCTKAGFTMDQMFSDLGFMVARIGSSRCSISPVERSAQTIAQLKPSVILGTPHDFLCVMEAVREFHPEEYPQVVSQLKLLFGTAEPCAVSRKELIESAYGITHIHSYLSVDGLISFNCPCGENHLIDKMLHTEVQTASGTQEFGHGELVYTTLLKSVLSIMYRFNIGDIVTIKKSDCPYGSNKTIIPHGRKELVQTINGKQFYPIDVEEAVYSDYLWFSYSISIYDSHVEITLEENGAEPFKGNEKDLSESFATLFGMEAKVSVVKLGTLTDYKGLRMEKSILKIQDCRSSAKGHGIRFL